MEIISNNKLFTILLIVVLVLTFTPDKILQKFPPIWNFKLFVKNTFSEATSITSDVIKFFKKNLIDDTQTILKDNEDLFQGLEN